MIASIRVTLRVQYFTSTRQAVVVIQIVFIRRPAFGMLIFTLIITPRAAFIVGHFIMFTFTFHVVSKSGVHIRVEIVDIFFKVHLIELRVLIVLVAEVAVLTVVVVVSVLVPQRVALFGIEHARLVLVAE